MSFELKKIDDLDSSEISSGILLLGKKSNKLKNYFNEEFCPYEIGYISKSEKKINLINKIKW